MPVFYCLQVSRAEILKKSTDYIQFMRNKNNSFQSDIDDLKRQNNVLEQQGKYLETFKKSLLFYVLRRID